MKILQNVGFTFAMSLGATATLAATVSDGAFGDLNSLSPISPNTAITAPSAQDLEALASAQANFATAIDLLEQELRTRAAYGSILALAPQLKTFASTDARLFWLHAIALAATGDLDAAREAANAAVLFPQTSGAILRNLADAMIAHREGRLTDAEAILEQAVAATPDYAFAQNLLGMVQSSLGKDEEAAPHFRTAAKLAPETPLFQRNLGLAEFNLDRAEPAEAALRAALALDPTDCMTLVALAQVQAALQQLPAAEETVRQCVDAGQAPAIATGYLVELQVLQRKLDAALATIDAHIADLPNATALRVEVLLRQARPGEALSVLDSGATNNAATKLRRVLATAMAGDTTAALSMFRDLREATPADPGKALIEVALSVAAGAAPDSAALALARSDPDLAAPTAAFEALAAPREDMAAVAQNADDMLPGVRFHGVPDTDWTAVAQPANRKATALGLLWLLRGNDLAARQSFSKVTGTVHFVTYLDAVAATRLGDRETAASLLEPTAAALPKFYSAQVLMGELLAGRGKLAEALAHYRNAVAEVDDSGALMRTALIADYLGEVDVAEQALRRFITLFPESFIGYNQFAWLLIQREIRLDEALALARKADELRPGNASVLDNLGWVEYLNGDAVGALAKLREANRVSGSMNPDIVYHLAVVEAEVGSIDTARDLLERFAGLRTENHPVSEKARALLGSLN